MSIGHYQVYDQKWSKGALQQNRMPFHRRADQAKGVLSP